jgi:Protein of unknown function (DUF2971)
MEEAAEAARMPTKLYKYRPFGVNALRNITEAEVFYARPDTFNDPMDCDPTVEVDVDRSRLEKLYYRMLLRRLDKDAALQEIGELRYLSTEYGDYKTDSRVEEYLVRMLASRIKSEVDAELSECGVLTLSAVWSSPLMWSHYANDHRGICIEYDTSDQAHPRLAAVNYRAPRAIKTSDLLRWKVQSDPAATSRVMETFFYAKSSEWKYEKEWRDVHDKNGTRYLPFRITAIHFGLRCDTAVITSVVKLLNDRPNIKLYGIRPKDRTFRLARFLIDRDEIEAVGVSDPPFLAFKDFVGDVDDHPDVEEVSGIVDEPAQI